MRTPRSTQKTAKTAERREELRIALIEAAERTVAAKGLDSLKARDLAEEVGCAVGAIYNVFPDLDALVLEVNARTLALFEKFVAGLPERAPEGESDPAERLVGLGIAYLDFAVANHPRWRALFEHRLSDREEHIPDWYASEQARLFRLVEGPVAQLQPDLPPDQLGLFARIMFSSVHGIVSLGLDDKLDALPATVLDDQIRKFVRTLARGLSVGSLAG